MTAPYAMTNAPRRGVLQSSTRSVAPYGIDVTKINPGPYDTGFNDKMVDGIAEFIEPGDDPAGPGGSAHSHVGALQPTRPR